MRRSACSKRVVIREIVALVSLFLVLALCSGFYSSTNIENDYRNTGNLADPKPSTVFPVAGKRAKIGSFWGAIRDGGKRKHEGIDIFAPKRTPVVAVTDGIVSSIGNGGRGGKTVWLRSLENGFTYYYAHLDKHSVRTGQTVKKGDQIGTVGNTGNAKLTPPHLHFGIYTFKGAVNPLPYVKNSSKIPLPLKPNKETLAHESSPKQSELATRKPINTSRFISSKHIWKTIQVPADPSAKYFVTVRSNVVRVTNEKLSVIGTFKKGKTKQYPYYIDLLTKEQLKVDGKGNVLTQNGTSVGTISNSSNTRIS